MGPPEIAIIHIAIAAGECAEQLHRKDGPLFWNELILSPIHADDGELSHYIGMQRDVTELMELIRPLQKQKEDLQYENQRPAQPF